MSDGRMERLLEDLWRWLPDGRGLAMSGAVLADELGVSTRTIRELVGELIDRGHLVGSTCSGERAGYFRIRDFEDCDIGTAHLRSRALSMLRRYRTLQKSAAEQLGPEALRLFDLDEVSA